MATTLSLIDAIIAADTTILHSSDLEGQHSIRSSEELGNGYIKLRFAKRFAAIYQDVFFIIKKEQEIVVDDEGFAVVKGKHALYDDYTTDYKLQFAKIELRNITAKELEEHLNKVSKQKTRHGNT